MSIRVYVFVCASLCVHVFVCMCVADRCLVHSNPQNLARCITHMYVSAWVWERGRVCGAKRERDRKTERETAYMDLANPAKGAASRTYTFVCVCVCERERERTRA